MYCCDVQAEDVQALAGAGLLKEPKEVEYEMDKIEDVIKFSIHGTDANFISRARSQGHTDLSLDGYKKLKILGKVN
jgi:hypothetical protein